MKYKYRRSPANKIESRLIHLTKYDIFQVKQVGTKNEIKNYEVTDYNYN